MPSRIIAIVAASVASVILLASSIDTIAADRKGWLTDAPDDAARWKRIERYVGGFSTAMAVVGERYTSVQSALKAENWELARYHWRYLKRATEQGILRRPKRAPNANTMFLDTAWPAFDEALKTGDRTRILSAYQDATAACQACHVAEGKAFMNNQPMFQVTID